MIIVVYVGLGDVSSSSSFVLVQILSFWENVLSFQVEEPQRKNSNGYFASIVARVLCCSRTRNLSSTFYFAPSWHCYVVSTAIFLRHFLVYVVAVSSFQLPPTRTYTPLFVPRADSYICRKMWGHFPWFQHAHDVR